MKRQRETAEKAAQEQAGREDAERRAREKTKPEKEETPKPKKVRTRQNGDSKIVGILAALGLMLLLIFGLPALLINPKKHPSQP